ncbi:MAG: HAD family phosphatase [Burkholderiaceae bacterium]|nr:HAD family phosphatase [Roseateles sp.]MBV8470000.1 HAD family phosphatase [Burkholderiaceae bacterium]
MKVVFDFGGVLFRWHPPSFLARVWPHRVPDLEAGVEVARQFFQHYGGDWGAFDQGLIDAETVVARIAARTGWPFDEVRAVVDAVPDELQVLPETVALIEELKSAGHRLYYLSNMPEPYADHLERSYPLHEWFDGGVFSGRVKRSKPSAEAFQCAARAFDAAPQELVLLDDLPANIAAARAQGWQGLEFSTAGAVRPALMALLQWANSSGKS